jgi:CRISPR-associated endonuclease Csn1
LLRLRLFAVPTLVRQLLLTMSTVWSFDLGIGSIGEAVRDTATHEFLHVASLLIPQEFASTKEAGKRRRMYRTRLAHQAREAWLDHVWKTAGQIPLQKRTVGPNPETGKWELKQLADPRLEREFAAQGDSTCYTSCLLRIRLLRGETLEAWQIYKALHSAIQRRGYDPDIPWKAKESGRRKEADADKEEGKTKERMNRFTRDLEAMFPDREEYRLQCYFDAVKMGLLDPANPALLKERIDHTADTTRNQIVPRWMVEKEVRLLCEQAAKQIPALHGKADFLLWGPAEQAYASYDVQKRKQFGLREGGVTDWQGVVGQKIPRFDNRIIEKCSLIPRLNVCKIKSTGKEPLPESRVVFEATFLMKLRNMRVQDENAEQRGLTVSEVREIFSDAEKCGYKISATQWKKWCIKFGVRPLPGHEEVEAPRGGGRSRFCRPGLEILKRLILSGHSPKKHRLAELERLGGNTHPQKGLVEGDLVFLERMGDSWEKIYIPDQKLDVLLQSSGSPEIAVRRIIGSQNDPVVRHRLGQFHDRIKALHEAHGVPETVAIEFIRTDFMGPKALMEYRKFIKERENQRKKSREEAALLGASSKSGGLKMELYRIQGGVCLYTGEALMETELDLYQIDHIVPRERGGPDSVLNYLLTTQKANAEKGVRTPFEWLSRSAAWDAYVNRINGKAGSLRNKKVKLLLNEDAVELAERYTSLAETAWITKLSRAILDAHFGWRNGIDEQGVKRVAVINGGLTARVRRKYKLNSILHPDTADESEAEKKNRNDNRHHALDAMVINFIPGWTRDAAKEHFFRFPDGIQREFFQKYIDSLMPRKLCFEKPTLAATVYGGRGSGKETIIVQRTSLLDMGFKPIAPGKTAYDLGYLTKQVSSIRDAQIRGIAQDIVQKRPEEPEWRAFCETFTLPRADGSKGSRVKIVTVDVGGAEEYRDFSKDGCGAYRKASGSHKGQVVYRDPTGKYRVRPVYVFESVGAVREEVRLKGGVFVEFFQSGCTVSLDTMVEHKKTPLPAGTYILGTMRGDGYTVLRSSQGGCSPISIETLIKAGLKRI